MSHAAVCRAAGIKRSTLAQQFVRGRVTVSTIAAVSRSLRQPVIATLAQFPAYKDLQGEFRPPTDAELLSQVSNMDILAEIVRRNGEPLHSVAHPPVCLGAIPHRDSVRTWIDAIGDSDLRKRLAAETGIAPQNLSAQISANRLKAEVAISAAQLADVGVTNGLVATGFISAEEAGWAPNARHDVVARTPTSHLATLAADRMENLGRSLRRSEQEFTQDQKMWNHLG